MFQIAVRLYQDLYINLQIKLFRRAWAVLSSVELFLTVNQQLHGIYSALVYFFNSKVISSLVIMLFYIIGINIIHIDKDRVKVVVYENLLCWDKFYFIEEMLMKMIISRNFRP